MNKCTDNTNTVVRVERPQQRQRDWVSILLRFASSMAPHISSCAREKTVP